MDIQGRNYGPNPPVASYYDRAIARAVSRRLPTAAARVRARVRSCRIFSGQSDTGAGFLRVLRFPLPIRIPPTAPHPSSSIIWGWYNRPNGDWSTKWTQSHPTKNNKKNISYYAQIFSSLHYTVDSNILLYFLIYLAYIKRYCDGERNLSRDSDRSIRFEPLWIWKTVLIRRLPACMCTSLAPGRLHGY
jgi:hypothetical protein